MLILKKASAGQKDPDPACFYPLETWATGFLTVKTDTVYCGKSCHLCYENWIIILRAFKKL
jgi:hypothetical protein